MESEKQANNLLRMIVNDTREAFPEFTDEQIWDFSLSVIQKVIKKLKSAQKQLNLFDDENT